MKKYRKFNLIIVLLLIVAFSNTGTFAAFNDEISNIFESYNGTNNSLAIKNGKIQLDFSSEDSSKVWRIGGTDGTVIPATGEITKLNGDKVSEIRATYGPILIKNTSDLTTKIDLKVLYGMKTDVGNITYTDDEVNLADPFEVIVGDMDNSNYEFTSSENSPYSGKYLNRSSIDIKTNEDDALGTDRRLIASGFKDLLASISGGDDPKNYINYVNHTDMKDYYKVTLKNDYVDSARGINISKDKYICWLDGYADRLLRGVGDRSNYICNGVNWKYIQGSEPLTFKYDPITDGERVKSAQIYLYIADLQSGLNNISSVRKYESASQSSFTAYLIDEEGIKYPIPELDSTLNSIMLGGPSGYIMAMNIPKRLLYLIEKNSQISFKIDDERFAATGDGFDIDFAKLVVNNPQLSTSTATISGKITDKSGNPISGAIVRGGDGVESQPSDSEGNYTLVTSAGVVTLTAFHNDYVSDTFTFTDNIVSGDVTSHDFSLESSMSKADSKEKFKVKLKLECKGENEDKWNEISFVEPEDSEYNNNKEDGYEKLFLNGTQVESVTKQVAVEPKKSYRVTYEVVASNRDYIYENAMQDFYTEFYSEIVAKVSQENNTAWDSNGGGADYFPTYTDGTTIIDSGKDLTGTIGGTQPDEKVSVLVKKVTDEGEILVAEAMVDSSLDFKYSFKLQNGKYKIYIKSKVHQTEVSDIIDVSSEQDSYVTDINFSKLKNTVVKMEQPRNHLDAIYYKFKYKSNLNYYNSTEDLTTISAGTGPDEYSYEKNDKWNVWKFNAPRETYYGVQVKLYNDSAFSSEAYNTKPMYSFYTQNVYICPN